MAVDEWWMSMRFIGFKTSTQQKFQNRYTPDFRFVGFRCTQPNLQVKKYNRFQTAKLLAR
jgi:hypothetical protein